MKRVQIETVLIVLAATLITSVADGAENATGAVPGVAAAITLFEDICLGSGGDYLNATSAMSALSGWIDELGSREPFEGETNLRIWISATEPIAVQISLQREPTFGPADSCMVSGNLALEDVQFALWQKLGAQPLDDTRRSFVLELDGGNLVHVQLYGADAATPGLVSMHMMDYADEVFR